MLNFLSYCWSPFCLRQILTEDFSVITHSWRFTNRWPFMVLYKTWPKHLTHFCDLTYKKVGRIANEPIHFWLPFSLRAVSPYFLHLGILNIFNCRKIQFMIEFQIWWCWDDMQGDCWWQKDILWAGFEPETQCLPGMGLNTSALALALPLACSDLCFSYFSFLYEHFPVLHWTVVLYYTGWSAWMTLIFPLKYYTFCLVY